MAYDLQVNLVVRKTLPSEGAFLRWEDQVIAVTRTVDDASMYICMIWLALQVSTVEYVHPETGVRGHLDQEQHMEFVRSVTEYMIGTKAVIVQPYGILTVYALPGYDILQLPRPAYENHMFISVVRSMSFFTWVAPEMLFRYDVNTMFYELWLICDLSTLVKYIDAYVDINVVYNHVVALFTRAVLPEDITLDFGLTGMHSLVQYRIHLDDPTIITLNMLTPMGVIEFDVYYAHDDTFVLEYVRIEDPYGVSDYNEDTKYQLRVVIPGISDGFVDMMTRSKTEFRHQMAKWIHGSIIPFLKEKFWHQEVKRILHDATTKIPTIIHDTTRRSLRIALKR